MNEYIKEIEEIAVKCSCSQSDGYAQIMRICEAMKEIHADVKPKYCYEDLSNAEHRGYCNGLNQGIDDFANYLHEIAKANNGLRLSSERKSWTHPCIYDYVKEFKTEQICKLES